MKNIYYVEVKKNNELCNYICLKYKNCFYDINNNEKIDLPMINYFEYDLKKLTRQQKRLTMLKAYKTKKIVEREFYSSIKNKKIYKAIIKVYDNFLENGSVYRGHSGIICEVKDVRSDYVFNVYKDIYQSVLTGMKYEQLKKIGQFHVYSNLIPNLGYITQLEDVNPITQKFVKKIKV